MRVVDLHRDTGLPDPAVHTHVRAIGWHRHGGIMSTRDGNGRRGGDAVPLHDPDGLPRGLRAETRGLSAPVPISPVAGDADIEGPFMPLEVIPWRFGVEWTARRRRRQLPRRRARCRLPVAYQRRWFFAFMRLCWQEIIVRHTTHEPRHNHRRWERLAQRKDAARLHDAAAAAGGRPDYEPSGMGVPLDHRVKVRAHWRRQ